MMLLCRLKLLILINFLHAIGIVQQISLYGQY
nr:MAG TPA: hypothetical protein [Caudoviricetes sp.]